jgi:heme exporter protein B
VSLLRCAGRIAAKDLRIELRTRDVVTAMGMFALLIIVVASFSFPMSRRAPRAVAAGLLWMAFLFAILLGIGRSTAMEHEDDCHRCSGHEPGPRESIYLGKVLANLAFVGVTQLFLLPDRGRAAAARTRRQPAAAAAHGRPRHDLALVAVTTLFSAMAINTRPREAILPILVIPVAIPVLIAAVRATEIALSGGDPTRPRRGCCS